jgi:hypothetical protein
MFVIKNAIKPFDKTINWDKFESIVKTQRLFGLSYNGFYKSKKNILNVLLFDRQVVNFGVMLNLCSPFF